MLFHAFALVTALRQATMFEIDMWPEEGRPVFQAVAKTLQLRAAPSSSSPVVMVPVQAGRRLAFDQTLYRTTRAGSFTSLKASVVAGRDLGNITSLAKPDYYSAKFPPISLSVMPGETIEPSVPRRGDVLRSAEAARDRCRALPESAAGPISNAARTDD
jgi:hypothetical protein